MSASKPHRARVGYLTIHPGTGLKDNKLRLEQEIEYLRKEARERVAEFGLEMVGEPMAMVTESLTVLLDDPLWHEEIGWGPSIGIFVEVHVKNPFTGEVIYPFTD